MSEFQIKNLVAFPSLKYKPIFISSQKVILAAEVSRQTAVCPVCKKISRHKHSHYTRVIRDLPICGKQTYIHLKIRRFKCQNKHCEKRIFSEQPEGFAPYSRLSNRARDTLTKIMIEISANKGSVISKYIALNISSSTCLRLVHSLKLPILGQISHLGIDDWALRKWCSYGTALVDMDTSRVVDLLPGRDGESLSEWLGTQNDIKTVNRDRAGSYASVVSKVNQRAEQIADRFHLIKNLSEHIESIMFSNSALINKIVSQEKSIHNSVKLHHNSQFFDIAKSKLAMGYSQTKVAKDLNLSRYTIWKYAHSDAFPSSSRRTSIFDKYKFLIERELAAGTSLHTIHKMIVKAGYKGARSNFYIHFGTTKSNPFEKVISMKVLSKYMFSKNIRLISSKIERNQIELLSEKLPWIIPLNKLCSSFSELLKNGNKESLDKWLADAQNLNIKRLCRFVGGIRKDYNAVLNAVIHSSSSGVVEGNINRLKCIKRQMYGRASIELLKRKVILAASG